MADDQNRLRTRTQERLRQRKREYKSSRGAFDAADSSKEYGYQPTRRSLFGLLAGGAVVAAGLFEFWPRSRSVNLPIPTGQAVGPEYREATLAVKAAPRLAMPVDGKGWTDCGSASAVSGNSGMDLVLAVDTTGSMGGVLDDIKTNILTLFKNLGALGAGVRVGLVDYKDLCDVNMLRQMPLTAIDDPGGISALTSFVASMQAGGGCDWPEKMDLALNAAASMIWRGTVPASIVVIADAPAHPEDESTSYSIAGAFVSKIPGGQVSLVDTGSGGHPFMQSLPRYGGGQYVTYDGDILKSLYPAISGCSET